MAIDLRWCLTLFCCTISLGCSSALDPDSLPYRLEMVEELGPGAHPADLDGDGRDELAHIHSPSHGPDAVEAVWIRTQNGQTIEQVNYEGRILPLHFLDLSGDDRPEVLVPYVRNDSLFLSVLDGQGRKQLDFFLIRGEPRHEPNGTIPWDPNVRRFYVTDADSDGGDELITVLFTGFAQLPRGILIHHLPSGRPGNHKIIGAAPGKSFLGDFDGDGASEIALETFSPNNGAEAGGFNDQHSYIIVFELGASPEVTWSKTVAEKWSGANLSYDDFDRDGRREFLSVATSASASPEQAQFELIEPGTWRILRRRTFSELLRWATPIDLNRDARPEIIAVRQQQEIWALNHEFQRTRRRAFDVTLARMQTWPDMDDDGIDEIVAFSPSGKNAYLLGPNFRIKATFSSDTESIKIHSILRRGFGTSPYLLIDNDNQTVALRLVENQFYWFYRYGLPVLGGIGLFVILGLVVGGRRLYRRNRLLHRLHHVVFDTVRQGMMVVNPDGTIVLMNPVAREDLALDGPQELDGKRFDDVLDGSPALRAFLRRTFQTDPPHHQEETLALVHRTSHAARRVTAEPVPLSGRQKPYWLIAFQQDHHAEESINAKTWAMMARKVTHDIKNPLTNILLTTQRLQSEYRKRFPTEAGALDPYAERIVDRVTHLRRLTKQFMKILDIDALEVVKTDLARLLRDAAEAIERDLPPDVDLVLDLSSDLPGVWVDREQISTALDNLMSNAIHALPEGGTITLSAYPVRELRSSHTHYEPADYAVIEVQDNGVGIAPDNRTRLFEPGFTTSEFGTGLGLALVKHVVEHHGGFIEVESVLDIGSVFSIHLPTIDPTAPERHRHHE